MVGAVDNPLAEGRHAGGNFAHDSFVDGIAHRQDRSGAPQHQGVGFGGGLRGDGGAGKSGITAAGGQGNASVEFDAEPIVVAQFGGTRHDVARDVPPRRITVGRLRIVDAGDSPLRAGLGRRAGTQVVVDEIGRDGLSVARAVLPVKNHRAPEVQIDGVFHLIARDGRIAGRGVGKQVVMIGGVFPAQTRCVAVRAFGMNRPVQRLGDQAPLDREILDSVPRIQRLVDGPTDRTMIDDNITTVAHLNAIQRNPGPGARADTQVADDDILRSFNAQRSTPQANPVARCRLPRDGQPGIAHDDIRPKVDDP